MNTVELTKSIKSRAHELGFDLVAACPTVTPRGLSRFQQWLDAGYHGEMSYLSDRRDAYQHPEHVMNGAKSVVVLATNYRSTPPRDPGLGQGRVSCYAWGTQDYHDVIHDRLKQLKNFLHDRQPALNIRGVVDTAPLLEREFARLAGIGWQGKNTMLISKQVGSYFFLSCLLLDVELAYDAPHETDHCGTCTACLDACPTQAFPEPHVLDATKCISYLTIELRDEIPEDLRAPLGNWLFGCDICQDVCPWNRHAPTSDQPPFAPHEDMNPVDLSCLFDLDEQAFRDRFRKTPLWRAKRRGILRNAAVILGNQQDVLAIDALTKGLHDVEPLVRSTSAWALGQIAENSQANSDCRRKLTDRLAIEPDTQVKTAIHSALEQSVMPQFPSESAAISPTLRL